MQRRRVKLGFGVVVFVRLCVVQSAITSHLFKRGLVFPYKARAQFPSKTVKRPSQTRIPADLHAATKINRAVVATVVGAVVLLER